MAESEAYSEILTEDQTEDESLFDFYCPTCLLSFGDDLGFKQHYKSELHQYNVKRKLVDLKPIRMEYFEEVKQSKLSHF
jgi:hypothetical protein